MWECLQLNFLLFRLTVTFPVAAQVWNAFPLSFLSPPLLLGIFFILPGSSDAVFLVRTGLFCQASALPPACCCFPRRVPHGLCLCHALDTCGRNQCLAWGSRELSLGKYSRKGGVTVPLHSEFLEKNHLATERTSRCVLTSFPFLREGDGTVTAETPSGVSSSSCVVPWCLTSVTTCVTAHFGLLCVLRAGELSCQQEHPPQALLCVRVGFTL